MGVFFPSLYKKNPYKKIEIDFSNLSPDESNAEICERADLLTATVDQLIASIRDYKDCSEEISQIINADQIGEAQFAPFSVLNENVSVGKALFSFSEELNQFIAEFFTFTEKCLNISEGNEILAISPIVAYKTTHLLSKVLQLDQAKMHTPSLQNNLSFYRRILTKVGPDTEISISRENINSIISFFAEQMSLCNKLSQSLVALVEKNAVVPALIANIAMGYFYIVEAEKFPPNSKENLDFLRAVAVLTINYDYVFIDGVFSKNSQIDLRQIVRFLRLNPLEDKESCESLVKTIKYGCVQEHFAEASSAITSLFE